MAYTQNESIDWLTAITPTTDDIVVTMDQAEIGVAKTSTLLSIYNLFKTTYDTVYAKYLGDADFYKYSIVRSVWNLIVNNSFETDLSWWSGWLSASFTRVTSQFFHWTASAQIVTDWSTYAQWCYSAVTTKVWSTYAYSCYVKGTAWKQISMLIDWWTYPEFYQTLTWWWDRITGSVTATTTNTSIYIQCRTAWVTTYWVDAVQVEEWTTVAWPFTTTQWNLTVALKNYEGNDPTASKPVKIQIWGVVYTITGAITRTHTAGTNYYNLWSTELATKEVDLFIYLCYSTISSSIVFWFSRIPSATVVSDFSWTVSNEKYSSIAFAGTANATDSVVNIGRFNAILSAGAGYTWSIPATSIVVNSPIRETRWLDFNTVFSTTWTAFTNQPAIFNNWAKYKIEWDKIIIKLRIRYNTTSGGTGWVYATLPFSTLTAYQSWWWTWLSSAKSLASQVDSNLNKILWWNYDATTPIANNSIDEVWTILTI